LHQSLASKSDLNDLDARSITPFVAVRLTALGRGGLTLNRTETAVSFSASLPHGA
jgi:hypothetical protein